MVISLFHLYPAVHIIWFCVSFLSWVDELNKLSCFLRMGLHSTAGRALQHKRRGHRFKPHWSPPPPPQIFFWGTTLQLLKLWFNCDGHMFTSFVFRQFTSFHSLFHSFHGLMNVINCPALRVWVLIAQLVEHCSMNAKAMGWNPLWSPAILFLGLLHNCLNCYSTVMVTSSLHLYFCSSKFISCCVSFTSWVELNKLATSQGYFAMA